MKLPFRKILIKTVTLLVVFYALLLIPDSETEYFQDSDKIAFAWNSDQYWTKLENRFVDAKKIGCDNLSDSINISLIELDSMTQIIEEQLLSPNSSSFKVIENKIFDLSVLLGACPDSLERFIQIFGKLRTALKNQSINWDSNEQTTHDCIYRLLYGGRTAIEEIILQAPDLNLPEIIVENNELSSTPSARILGAKIHSGDILVSRGGAPTSALIARGNDYPGNFSHIAIVHVDDISGKVSIIESHIEIGVVITDIDSYFKDKKLRVMVLRPRFNLPHLQSDPMIPHKAATYALNRAQSEHIPYDFAMNTEDPNLLFCSEVASNAYQQYDIQLWSTLSHISSVGVRNWLGAFGVEYFMTMEPSDLEYDPQLTVIAEWRDYESLYNDHIDNAVVDMMLELAENGARIDYKWQLLPIVRILKSYSYMLNLFGKAGPIPEGMSATAALKNEWFSEQQKTIVEKLKVKASEFNELNGYVPPYWELIKLARPINAQ